MGSHKNLANRRQLSMIEELDDSDDSTFNRDVYNENYMFDRTHDQEGYAATVGQKAKDLTVTQILALTDNAWNCRLRNPRSEMSVIPEPQTKTDQKLVSSAKYKPDHSARTVSDLVCGGINHDNGHEAEDYINANIPDNSTGDLDDLVLDEMSPRPPPLNDPNTPTGHRQTVKPDRQVGRERASTESIQEMFQVLIKSIEGGFHDNQIGHCRELQADDIPLSHSLTLLGQEKVEGQPLAVDSIISTFKEKFSLPSGKHQPVRQKSRRTLELEKLEAANDRKSTEIVNSKNSAERTAYSNGDFLKTFNSTESGFSDITKDNTNSCDKTAGDIQVHNMNENHSVTHGSDLEICETIVYTTESESQLAETLNQEKLDKGEEFGQEIKTRPVLAPLIPSNEGELKQATDSLYYYRQRQSIDGNVVVDTAAPPVRFDSSQQEKAADNDHVSDSGTATFMGTRLNQCTDVGAQNTGLDLISADGEPNMLEHSLADLGETGDPGSVHKPRMASPVQTPESPATGECSGLASFLPSTATGCYILDKTFESPIQQHILPDPECQSWTGRELCAFVNHGMGDKGRVTVPSVHVIDTDDPGTTDQADNWVDHGLKASLCTDSSEFVQLLISSQATEGTVVVGNQHISNGNNDQVDQVREVHKLGANEIVDAGSATTSSASSHTKSTTASALHPSCRSCVPTLESTSSPKSSTTSFLTVPGPTARMNTYLQVSGTASKPPMIRHVSQPNLGSAAHSARSSPHPHDNNNYNGKCKEAKYNKDLNSDLAKLKATATRLKLVTRRPSYVSWLEEHEERRRNLPLFGRFLAAETSSEVGECDTSPGSGTESMSGNTTAQRCFSSNHSEIFSYSRPGVGVVAAGGYWNSDRLTSHRKRRIEKSLDWLRKELQVMRTQDQVLARQLLTLYHDIHRLRLSWSCQEHRELLDEVQYDLEELYEFSSVLDLPMTCLLNSPLKQVGVTRLNISARRFSTC